MKVLVTGGTGFVGREVLRQLCAAGHEPRVLARSVARARQRLADIPGVQELHEGDVNGADSLDGAVTGCDAVIHLVGIISEARAITFERLHVEATRNVLAAAQASGVRRYVHMSALGTRPDAVSRYHQTKWAAEERVRSSGLDWTIFRPSLIYGPEDQFVNVFASLSKWSPVLPLMGRPDALLQPVSVENVARCFVGALTRPESVGKTCDVCGVERLTLEQILDAILAATGRRRLKVRVPLALARAQAAAMEFVWGTLLGKPPPLNRDQLQMLQEDNVADAAATTQAFSLAHQNFRVEISDWLCGSSPETSDPLRSDITPRSRRP